MANKQELKDTEVMVQWRSIIQEETNIACRKYEEVLEKYKVEVCKRLAYKGRGEPSEWRMVRESRNINLENGVKTVGQESSHHL